MTVPPMVRDEDWFKRFEAELQLRGATGREVGEAVAAVDEYCRDSGSTPTEAFGDPRHYAADVRHRGLDPRTIVVRLVAPAFLLLWAVAAAAVVPLRVTGSAAIPWTWLVWNAVWLAFTLVVQLTWPRFGMGGRFVIFFVTFMAAQLGVQYLRDQLHGAAFHVPSPLMWAALVVLLTTCVLAVRAALRNRVVDPRTGLDRWSLPTWAVAVLPWLVPLLCLGILAIRLAVA